MQQMKKMFLVVFLLLTLLPAYVYAALPDIDNAIEPRLHKGTSEEISSFIKERLAQAALLGAEAGELLHKTGSQPEQEALAGAVDIFQGIPAQMQRLESELKKSTDFTVKAPQLGDGPYSPADFNTIRSFQQEVEQQLREGEKDIDRLGKKLSTVKKNLESLLFDYARMKQMKTETALAFEKTAYIYSLQAEYSFITLQLARLERRDESLAQLQEKGSELIKTCLGAIQVPEVDVGNAKTELEKATRQENLFLEEAQKENNILNNKLLRYELQLENVMGKLDREKEDCEKKQLLKTDQKRIASIIDTVEIKLRTLDQKKLNKKINIIDASFTHDWLKRYAEHDEKSVREPIQDWRKKQEFLQNTAKNLKEEMSQVNIEKSRLTQKLLLVADELKEPKSLKLTDSLAGLEGQLLKENASIDELIATLSDNRNDLREVFDEISWFIDVLLTEMPWYENLQVYFEKNLRKSWETTCSVLYYPFLSMGMTKVTLAVVFKFVFLVTVGLTLLRLVRRKVVILLRNNTRLSFGSITSITTLGYYVILVLCLFVILNTVGVNLSQITVILGALGVGIGFGLQTIANNFISGIILLSEQTIKAGDIVNMENGLTGEVKKVAIRSTIIRTVNGDDIIVPNSEFVSGRVNTWTYGDDWRRLKIPFGVSYDSDPDEVARIAEEAAREVETTREDNEHPIRVFFEGYGDSSLDFSIRVWCRMNQLKSLSGLHSDYYFILYRKLKKAGVTIPFPQRDIHLQSIAPEVKAALDGGDEKMAGQPPSLDAPV